MPTSRRTLLRRYDMTKPNTDQSTHYLQAIIDYEINIEFCDKIVWLRPRTEGLSFLTEDVGIKLKDVGGDRMEAVKRGIDKILGSK